MGIINRVQITGNSAGPTSFGANANSPMSVSKAFGPNNTAGNTIIALVSAQNSVFAGVNIDTPAVNDTAGNVYTQLCWVGGGNQSGGAIGIYMATNILGGANTVTFSDVIHTISFGAGTFDIEMVIAEYSGFGTSPTASGTCNHYYSSGSFPQSLAVTDGFGTTATTLFTGFAGNSGVGSDMAAAVAVLSAAGAHYLIAGCRTYAGSMNVPTTTPGSYQTNALSQTVNIGSGADFMFYFDGTVPVLTNSQPQIFVVT